jgi:Ca2+/Na+ antiporter
MASGIIYLAIIGMWVAYFLPRWIDSRNEFTGKSAQRYRSALEVVAGNISPLSDVDRMRAHQMRLMRRRLFFALIVTSFLLTLIGAIMQTVTWTLLLLPVAGFIFYLAHVRHETNTEKIAKRRRDELLRTNAGISSTNLAEVITPHTVNEHWIPLAEREITGVTILPKGSQQAASEWDPQSIPVPTYVNAAKAVPSKRVIDLTEPGKWSEEQERLEREALAAAAPSRDQIFDQQLAEEAVTRLRENRAAGE